jgi:alpha-D-ribose 1-methylphosphonate 5-phosphate C-P lyase
MLKNIPNLSLYYSTDSENTDNAKVLSVDHGIKLAYLADTFAMGKEQLLSLVNVKGIPCPENNKKIPLIDKGGSACVKCSQCVVGRNNILFSATKK